MLNLFSCCARADHKEESEACDIDDDPFSSFDLVMTRDGEEGLPPSPSYAFQDFVDPFLASSDLAEAITSFEDLSPFDLLPESERAEERLNTTHDVLRITGGGDREEETSLRPCTPPIMNLTIPHSVKDILIPRDSKTRLRAINSMSQDIFDKKRDNQVIASKIQYDRSSWMFLFKLATEHLSDEISRIKSQERKSFVELRLMLIWLEQENRDLRLREKIHFAKNENIYTESASQGSNENIRKIRHLSSKSMSLQRYWLHGSLKGGEITSSILLILFSNDQDEVALRKLDLATSTSGCDSPFTPANMEFTLIDMLLKSHVTISEFIHMALKILSKARRTPTSYMCLCGKRNITPSSWKVHACPFEAWLIRLGIAKIDRSRLLFTKIGWAEVMTSISHDTTIEEPSTSQPTGSMS